MNIFFFRYLGCRFCQKAISLTSRANRLLSGNVPSRKQGAKTERRIVKVKFTLSLVLTIIIQ